MATEVPVPNPFEGLDEEMVRVLTNGIDPYTIIGQQQAELAKLRIGMNVAVEKLKQAAATIRGYEQKAKGEDKPDGDVVVKLPDEPPPNGTATKPSREPVKA